MTARRCCLLLIITVGLWFHSLWCSAPPQHQNNPQHKNNVRSCVWIRTRALWPLCRGQKSPRSFKHVPSDISWTWLKRVVESGCSWTPPGQTAEQKHHSEFRRVTGSWTFHDRTVFSLTLVKQSQVEGESLTNFTTKYSWRSHDSDQVDSGPLGRFSLLKDSPRTGLLGLSTRLLSSVRTLVWWCHTNLKPSKLSIVFTNDFCRL